MSSNTNNKTGSLPLHRVAVVRPFVNFLEGIGTPVERAFKRADLSYDALEFVDNYLPSHGFWTFLVDMAYSEGINDLGFRVGQQFGVKIVDPEMTSLLRRAPTLYCGLHTGSEVVNRTVTHCQMWVLQPPDSDYSYFYHKPSCSSDNLAVEQIGWFGLTFLVGIVRMYAGPRWNPKAIGVMTNHPPHPFIREHFPDSRMHLSQPYTYIAIENSLLSLPPMLEGTESPARSEHDYVPLPTTFATSLQLVLQAYVLTTEANLDMAARLCNMSKRTLQRRLADEGTSFNELLGLARYSVASRLLEDPSIKVADVARQLAYSDTSHFSRAFRRVAGVSPGAYRQVV